MKQKASYTLFHFWLGGGSRHLPYVGPYHLPVFCIMTPSLTQILHPMTSFSTTVHTLLFFSKIQGKISNFSHTIFLLIISWERQIFAHIWPNLHQMTPYFGKFTQKKAQFLKIPHPITPFLCKKSYTDCPVFILQYPSLSYSSAPMGHPPRFWLKFVITHTESVLK